MKKPPLTPEIREEFDKLDFLSDRIEEFSEPERIEIGRRWVDFMKKYQAHFSFTDQQIASTEASLKAWIAAIEKRNLAEKRHADAKLASELATQEFEKSHIEASEHYGRPFAFPAYKIGKRNLGN